jgi:hypothetical protein
MGAEIGAMDVGVALTAVAVGGAGVLVAGGGVVGVLVQVGGRAKVSSIGVAVGVTLEWEQPGSKNVKINRWIMNRLIFKHL